MKKMTFQNIKNILSRDEMKKIMAGSGNLCSTETQSCAEDSDCGTSCQCIIAQGGTCKACYTK
jgi:hypothetical protein